MKKNIAIALISFMLGAILALTVDHVIRKRRREAFLRITDHGEMLVPMRK